MDKRNSPNRDAAVIAAWYLFFGVLWILITDFIVYSAVENTQFAQNIKGALFVIVSSLLIFWLIKRKILQIEAANKAIERNLAELKETNKQLRDKEEKLRESRDTYALALRGVEGIWDYDFRNNELKYSNWITRTFGESASELFKNMDDLVHPEDLDTYYRQLNAYLRKEVDVYRSFYRLKDLNDNYIWVMNTGSAEWDENGEVKRMVGLISDFSEFFELREEVEKLAYYDQEANLPNKNTTYQIVSRKIKQNEEFSVLYIGLDDYIEIENALGHEYLTDTLIKMVDTIKKLSDNFDFFGYQNNYEFLIICQEENVKSLTDQLFARTEKLWDSKGVSHYLSLSIGVAYVDDINDSYQLIKNARLAMVEARKTHGNSIYYFTEEVSARRRMDFNLESELRLAIENNHLILEYQPVMNLEEDKIIGLEALIRWKHPKKGLIYPDDFIEFAESKGIIKYIGHFVINESIRKLKEWHNKGYDQLTMALNLSPTEFHQTDIVCVIEKALKENNLEGKYLRVEITEEVLIDDIARTSKLLDELKELGVKISLDDYGVGYSSFRHLQEMPIDIMKIDKSFVINMEYKKNKDFVRSAVDLGQSLSLDVIAEGIENESSSRFLKDIGCKYGQGYYYYKPLQADKFECLLEKK